MRFLGLVHGKATGGRATSRSQWPLPRRRWSRNSQQCWCPRSPGTMVAPWWEGISGIFTWKIGRFINHWDFSCEINHQMPPSSSVRGYRIPFVPSHYWWGYEMQLTIVIHSHSLCCECHCFLHIPQHIPGPRLVAPSFMVNSGDAQNSPNDDVLCISLQSNISWDSRPYCLLFMIHTWSIVSAILRIIFVDINLVKSNRTKSY